MKSKTNFRSRIGLLLLGVMLPAFAIPILACPIEVLYPLSGCFLLVILGFRGMRYIIVGDEIHLKLWFLGRKISITDIASIKRSYNPISSHAASFKRLEVRFKQREKNLYPCLISPVREKEFIEALKAVNPDIIVNVPERKGIWRFWDWDI